ncbi:hypothetical protein IHE44_0004847 [Lamprotornis superbus]|uniref:G-protein coupled receptors family 1 profile domain-containing protein n=1 Tax=Lamprotornis superbus TaxID=245042 RepID=A0A835NDQ6_9PASS|nr:hypothetical protein IHE44_0004847 [Lamprotornis superbus]
MDTNAQSEEMSNSSAVSHFLLLALADTRQLQLLHFCLFLAISLAALLANGLIISAVACGHHLHTPMFFSLVNLALTNLDCYIWGLNNRTQPLGGGPSQTATCLETKHYMVYCSVFLRKRKKEKNQSMSAQNVTKEKRIKHKVSVRVYADCHRGEKSQKRHQHLHTNRH